MNYRIDHQWLFLTIDDSFSNLSIEDFFHTFHLSKKTIHLYKQNKEYTLNGEYVNSATILTKDDVLGIHCMIQDIPFIPTKIDLDIVYEDDFILIVNKAKGINVHPDSPEQTDTLVNGVAYYLQDQNVSLRYIHRLDYDTTGLVIFTKCSFIQALLDYQMENKGIHRYYKAYVKGKLDSATVNQKIGRDRHNAKKMRVSPTGKDAITHIKKLNYQNNITEVECKLDTGRTHQIRVHLAYLRHPIIGDPLYNPEKSKVKLALHAYKIEMVHPITKKKLIVQNKSPYAYLLD